MTELPFKEPEFQEKWAEWLEYRKEKRLPAYKPIGLKKTFTALVRDSGGILTEAIDMLEYSMEKNWQGIFKRNKNGNQNNYKTGNGKAAGANQLLSSLKAELASHNNTGGQDFKP